MSDLIERLREFEGSDDLGNGDFSVCVKAADLIEAQQAEIARLRELAEWAAGRLEELNPSNYDYDDVCSVNDASVEVIVALQGALEQKP